MPTGSVDIAQVQGMLDAINAKLPNLELDWLPNFASDLLSGLDERLKQSGLPDDPDGSIETHHFILSASSTCTGSARVRNPPGACRRRQRRDRRDRRGGKRSA